tara:strand:+ start:418 stop:786 length:369 start_codon:yes stop_codon:yes gene_type:complete
MEKENVVILGASNNPNRYSHMALVQLLENGHNPILINPRLDSIDGFKCFPLLKNVEEEIDTLTIYVNPEISNSLSQEILALKVKRIIFNPGSENEALYEPLRKSGIEVIEACTLVMLRTGQF